MGDVRDKTGFPVKIPRDFGFSETAILVAKKKARTEQASDGDMVMLSVDSRDNLLVASPQLDRVITLLEEINESLKELRFSALSITGR